MAAEFDAAGFSALDQFFGSAGDGGPKNKNKNNNNNALGQEKDGSRFTKGNRRGVGSAVPVTTTQTTPTQSDLTKKLLGVGRKRRRHGEDDDHEDDEDVEDTMVNDEEHDEGGRTTIGAPRNSTKSSDTNATKKKLGKKERKKLQAQSTEDTSLALGSASENQKTTETTGRLGDEDVAPKEEEESRKKQKRRKIRSKQKNIRKDNREQEQKPNHLVVGRRNYNGRPLTAETRAKLHLPAPKARPAPAFVEQSHDEDHGLVEVGRLAIDDLLEDDTGKVVETPSISGAARKTKQKSKRPKYKNLKV